VQIPIATQAAINGLGEPLLYRHSTVRTVRTAARNTLGPAEEQRLAKKEGPANKKHSPRRVSPPTRCLKRREVVKSLEYIFGCECQHLSPAQLKNEINLPFIKASHPTPKLPKNNWLTKICFISLLQAVQALPHGVCFRRLDVGLICSSSSSLWSFRGRC
jgi:hypothetical protein